MNDFQNFLINLTNGHRNGFLELGSGNATDARLAVKAGYNPVIAVDIKEQKNMTDFVFLHGNYFSENILGSLKDSFRHNNLSLLYSAYSLCFNKKEEIIKYLPIYFSLLEKGGVFFLSDFSDNELVVKNRTPLLRDWFLELVKEKIGDFTVTHHEVFEKEHGHSHSIFHLIAVKTK